MEEENTQAVAASALLEQRRQRVTSRTGRERESEAGGIASLGAEDGACDKKNRDAKRGPTTGQEAKEQDHGCEHAGTVGRRQEVAGSDQEGAGREDRQGPGQRRKARARVGEDDGVRRGEAEDGLQDSLHGMR